MQIKDIMATDVKACTPDTNLAAAGALMLEADCGFLPVVADGRLVGVVTDRDMYIALATRNTLPAELKVGDVARAGVFTCRPDDEVHTALAIMKEHRVRRLPVQGFGGTVIGVVSVDDLVLAAQPRGTIRSDEVVDAYQAICQRRHPRPHIETA